MKKCLSIVAALVMAMLLLVPAPSRAEDVTLTWAVFETSCRTEAFYQHIIDAFERDNPGIRIERVLMTGNSRAEYLHAMLGAGTMPDINIEPADNIYLEAVSIDLPDYVVKGENLTGSVTLRANGDHSGNVYVRMRQYTLTNGGILFMGNRQVSDGQETTININSRINFDIGRYLILVEARRGTTEGTIGNYQACYKLIDVVAEPPAPPVTGDLNGDGKADVQDLNILLNVMLGLSATPEQISLADLDKSASVDVADMNMLINIIVGK